MKKNNKTTKPDNNFYEKFFPEAWCTETGIKFVEPGAVGLWSRMLWEIMWWSPNRGALLHGNGMQMTCKDIAKFFGYNEADVERWIEQLLREKVASTLRNGTIINRRMYYYYLKDNYITEIRKDAALSRWDERYTMQNSKNTHAKLCKPVAIAIDIDSSLLRKGGVGKGYAKARFRIRKS